MDRPLISIKNDCRSCYKCIRSCPTKSISFHDNQASIIQEECVLCGRCYTVCPQGCKVIRDDTERAFELLEKGDCYASLAPSFLGAYPNASLATFEKALKQLGFAGVEETAIGATIVKKAYDELVDKAQGEVILSTCCPAVNDLVRRFYPNIAHCLAPVVSPMIAHAKDIKRRHEDAKVIFIGPCIAKKGEADQDDDVDLALTFLELNRMLESKGIVIEKEEKGAYLEKSRARIFPTDGGILKTMEKRNPSYQYVSVSGMEEVMSALSDVASGDVHHLFLEVSACEGSCVNGPVLHKRNALKSSLRVRALTGNEDFETVPYSLKELSKELKPTPTDEPDFKKEDIQRILNLMGKYTKKDELNCGSCGYLTCREKAKAVLKGKAQVSMCLPYLMDKAMSFSNDVVESSPNGIIVIDENLRIQLANPVLASMAGSTPEAMIGNIVSDFIDPTLFLDALEGRNSVSRHIAWEDRNLYLEATVRHDERYHIVIGTFRDRTHTVLEMKEKRETAAEANRVTKEVIEKNMRAVQEIAELLGQSVAETKVALTNLSRVLTGEKK